MRVGDVAGSPRAAAGALSSTRACALRRHRRLIGGAWLGLGDLVPDGTLRVGAYPATTSLRALVNREPRPTEVD